jgi:hypothetical protein
MPLKTAMTTCRWTSGVAGANGSRITAKVFNSSRLPHKRAKEQSS